VIIEQRATPHPWRPPEWNKRLITLISPLDEFVKSELIGPRGKLIILEAWDEKRIEQPSLATHVPPHAYDD
jgi:hypothetical protein